MGACYDVMIRIHTDKPEELAAKLNKEADEDEKGRRRVWVSYPDLNGIPDHVHPEQHETVDRAIYGRYEPNRLKFNAKTLKGFIAILLAADQDSGYEECVHNGWYEASACFNASYGWAAVIDDNFSRMAEFCDRGELHVDMWEDGKFDSYISNYKIRKNKPTWLKKEMKSNEE